MENTARKIILKRLANLTVGQLRIEDGEVSMTFGDRSAASLITASMKITNRKFYQDVLFGGSIAAAETYASGYWETDDLTKLLRIFLLNQTTTNEFETGWAKCLAVLRWIAYQFKRNNLQGSRKNIAQHYDLSNRFFQLFLDKSLMYSSAIFPSTESTLDEAASYKIDVICKKLALKSSDKIIEIGSGWGGFAIHAAENYGCEVVTTTISQQQYNYASQQIREKKLGTKIKLLKQDYRQLEGKYDKLVSIEMIEAVGYQYYKQFFRTCSQLLKPEGEMLMQAIVIQDQAYERAKYEIDFIKQYIFPGSCIPSVTTLLDAMTKASNLRLFNLEDIGLHYAKTLRCWRQNFTSQACEIKKLGFDEHFIRLWNFYFCYCEAGFSEGYLGDMQMHFVHPLAIRHKKT
ncbi:SAM-dependent methyltransferase [Legionella feeleii]|uniref:Cyclopropane-fatty-acyl-phospholipid synthase n=1 Tax=Legionella feeleii TaxID=453 RepID=A0A0W0UBK2_9GAMM|nr:cyclopropane-fatty-acyl-phospholipid synthase family protein [Legionella feeleii]KTD05183.1 cyclopropane-fatty-acyl-phospholipid synthase [Legionella feeleii]SPX61061.1 cyclopropane-fatty-acyl-phospholipid synthase [Legionella feeleii]